MTDEQKKAIEAWAAKRGSPRKPEKDKPEKSHSTEPIKSEIEKWAAKHSQTIKNNKK